VWRPETWPSESSGLPITEHVRAARALRDALASVPMPPSVQVTILAGDCVPTATRILRRANGSYVFYPEELTPVEQPLARKLFEPGDGTVPVSSSAPNGGAELFCDGHQGIATDPNVHRALIRVLRGR
jgi:hypothetical protein